MKINRRTFMGGAAAGVLANLASVPAYASQSAPVAKTRFGLVQGQFEGAAVAFKGISYGADTSGKNRFRKPEWPAPWDNIELASEYGPACPQSRPASGKTMPEGESEDCLKLNVWTPGLRDKKGL